MVIILLFGLLGLLKLNVQSLPDFGFDLITISVDWKSASPRDVENQIIKSIEPEVRTIDGVRKVNSTAREGVGQLSIEFVKVAEPMLSPIDNEEIVNEPPSDTNNADAISVSPAS